MLTHVPPFREACWYEGRISSETFLPAFTCGAVGDLLREVAAEHPACGFTVLCGHTHSGGTARIAGNLLVHTGAAEYGSPEFVLISAGTDRVSVPERF